MRIHSLAWIFFIASACTYDEPAPPPAPSPVADEPPAAAPVALAPSLPDLPTDYEAWSACAKQQWLWARVAETAYAELPSWESAWDEPAGLFVQDNRVSIDRVSDVMPPFRRRRIHTFGSVATVALVPAPGAARGGMLAGAPCALARVALAATPGLNPITPGLALKLFVDGDRSTNLHVMPSLDGQGADTNLFARTYSNVLPYPRRPALQPIVALFAAVARNPLKVALDRLATVRQDGRVDPASVPIELRFLPTAEAQLPSRSPLDTRVLIARLPAGTRLFEVFAVDGPDLPPVHVADLVTTSPFVASRYGDEALFFKHEEAR